MRYLTYSELIFINGKLLNDPKILEGRLIRDVDLLLAAELRPQASAFGADAFPTLEEKAAVLLHGIARYHPFRDGNKRTATVATLFMLEVNGQRPVWQPAEALQAILDVAEGRWDIPDIVKWFKLVPVASMTEPDAETDSRAIERIIKDHRWLLNELELAGR
jgi:death-on-curing protein